MIKNHIRLLSGIITLHVISSKSPRVGKPQNIIDPERGVHMRAQTHTHTHIQTIDALKNNKKERDVVHIAEQVISPLAEKC